MRNIVTDNIICFILAVAILCAGSHQVPFMADEAMQAIPGFGKVDYTMKFYLTYLDKIRSCLKNLVKKGKYLLSRLKIA